jgi:hypothetical protein
MAPAIALVAFSNIWRTGNPLLSGYEMGFIYPMLGGIYGLLFSSGKSLFLYSPMLILLIPAARRALAEKPTITSHNAGDSAALERRAAAIWAIMLLGAQVLLYAKWWDWSGDDAWGPRFLIPGVMAGLLVVAATPLLSPRWRWAWSIVAAAGIVVNLPAALVGPHETLLLTHNHNPMKVDLLGRRSLVTMDDERFNPRFSPVVATLELLQFKLTGRIPHSADRGFTGSTWAECFEPPLQRSEVHFDLFWLDPLHRTPQKRESAGSTFPAVGAPPDATVPHQGIRDTAHRWDNAK